MAKTFKERLEEASNSKKPPEQIEAKKTARDEAKRAFDEWREGFSIPLYDKLVLRATKSPDDAFYRHRYKVLAASAVMACVMPVLDHLGITKDKEAQRRAELTVLGQMAAKEVYARCQEMEPLERVANTQSCIAARQILKGR